MSPYITIAIGYLAGSIPTGVILGRLQGKDPRSSGSGNIGASNVARVLGKKWGLFTLVFDVAKGWVPTAWALQNQSQDIALAVGAAAVIGHCFSIWLLMGGGKGVATAFGAMAAVLPMVAVISALVWFMLLFLTRTPALGSLTAAVLFVVLSRVEEHTLGVHLFTLGIAVIILLRHAGNLKVLKQKLNQNK